MKEIFGRTKQFRSDMCYAGVRSKIIPTAPAGEVFVGDSYNGVTNGGRRLLLFAVTWFVPERRLHKSAIQSSHRSY
jgi:hypothetical protein